MAPRKKKPQRTRKPRTVANEEYTLSMEMPPIVGFDVPTQFPNESISSGANYDPETPGLSSVIPQPVSALTTAEKALQYDTTGVAEFLYNRMNR
jgi:hypothetical protein